MIKSRRLRLGRASDMYGEEKKFRGCLVRNLEEKRPHERHKRRWEDVKMYLKGIGWKSVKSNNLAQDRTKAWLM